MKIEATPDQTIIEGTLREIDVSVTWEGAKTTWRVVINLPLDRLIPMLESAGMPIAGATP